MEHLQTHFECIREWHKSQSLYYRTCSPDLREKHKRMNKSIRWYAECYMVNEMDPVVVQVSDKKGLHSA